MESASSDLNNIYESASSSELTMKQTKVRRTYIDKNIARSMTEIKEIPGGRRVTGISGSLIWSKTLIALIFNPCGKFWWRPEGPVSQIHSPHLHATGILSDLLRSVQMLKREWDMESNGKLPHIFIPSKNATWFLSLQWKTCPAQNCNLGSCACSKRPALGQNTLKICFKW